MVKPSEGAGAPGAGGAEALRPEDAAAVAAAKARLAEGRADLRARHKAGAGGQEIVRGISALTDEVVRGLFHAIAGDDAPLALVATGGYGRRELSPRSDVDLLALLPGRGARRAEADLAAERLHRALWDAGLEAGYAARDLDQSLSLAREDHTARTNLLDCRLLCGDGALFKGFERAMVTELEAKRVEEFIEDKLEELRIRRARYGGSVWLLEPHLKQGKGGLRDLQCALWIARARHKVAGLGEAGERGLLPAREVQAARAARDWLWRLRNELHESTGRRDDRLTFDNQRKLAQALGFADAEGELGVERLMRQTYTALMELARASEALIDRCAVEDAPKPTSRGFFNRRPPQARELDAAFKVWQGRITVVDREVFARRPADLVRLFDVAETQGLPLYSYARDLLVQELGRLWDSLASDREAHQELWQLLTREGSDGHQLVAMHELGVLGALVPELHRLRGHAQHSLYHVYTVDTHTVFALQRFARLRAGALAESEPELTRVARALERPLVVALGLLFHDLGKGLRGDHSKLGAELVRGYAARIGLDPTDAADVEWLVRQHLIMSQMSQRRDLEDAAMIREFATGVRTVERLEMLQVLTYVDMASVSPENWTQWKAGLLQLLTDRARACLRGEGLDAPEHERSLEARRERLATALAKELEGLGRSLRTPEGDGLARRAQELSTAFVGDAPDRYLAVAQPADAARHLRLWMEAKVSGLAGELRRAPTGAAELALVAPDQPGLLALFSAALAASGIDVLGAEVNSFSDGSAVDLFTVREAGGGAVAPGRWEAARADLLRLLRGEEEAAKLVARKLRRASWASSAAPAVKTKIRVDNVSSGSCTILDVSAQDRPGLLHAIAEALRGAGASIELARVATEGNKAVDAFYVRALAPGGGKFTDPARLAELEAAVRAAIDEVPLG